MSRKEAPRVGLLNAVVAGRIRTREVAEALRVSERQVRRLRLGLRWVQLPPGPRRSWAGLRVELRELLDGRLVVLHDQRVLASQRSPDPGFVLRPRPLPRGTRRSRRPVHPPTTSVPPPRPTPAVTSRRTRTSATHPWRPGVTPHSRTLQRAWRQRTFSRNS